MIFNKKMHLKLVMFFLILGSLCVAQDTLVLLNGQKLGVRIIEKGDEVIRYTALDNPGATIEQIGSDKVQLVKYANNSSDVKTEIAPLGFPVDSMEILLASAQKFVPPDSISPLVLKKNKLEYQSTLIDDYELERLVMSYPYPENKQKLIKEFESLSVNKNIKNSALQMAAAGVIIPATVGAGLGLAALDLQGRTDGKVFAGSILGAAIIGVGCEISSLLILRKTNRKINQNYQAIVELYNQMK
jgi:hypothetical protein